MNATLFVLVTAAAFAVAYRILLKIDLPLVLPTEAERNTATLIAACVGALLASIALANWGAL